MGDFADLAQAAERPVVVAGHGIRLAGMHQAFRTWLEMAKIPCVLTWTGADLLPTEHPQNMGILGMCGQRRANAIVHDADLLIVLGSHLSLTQTGSATELFSPNSKRVFVNVDQAQLDNLTVRCDLAIHADLREWLKAPPPAFKAWNFSAYAGIQPFPMEGAYALNYDMTKRLPEGTVIVVDGGGTALYTGFQSSYIKEGSRLICSTAISAMGSGLPEAIGACFANGRKLTTCLIGDGSMMLNVQELQTIRTHNLPIKIFMISNEGYLAIRHTQAQFQEGRYYGTGAPDITFPRWGELARTFGIGFTRRTVGALNREGPMICEWLCDPVQPMLRQGFVDRKPLPLNQMVFQ